MYCPIYPLPCNFLPTAENPFLYRAEQPKSKAISKQFRLFSITANIFSTKIPVKSAVAENAAELHLLHFRPSCCN